jgi:tyrosine-protein kinase Etk/Wzc
VEKTFVLNDQKNDLKEIILLLYSYKKIFIITAVVFLFIAVIYNKSATPRYKNDLLLLIGENNANAFMSSKDLSEGFGLFGEKKNVDNELGILGSYTLIFNTVKNLNMDISYYQRKDILPISFLGFSPFTTYRETYKETPFVVVPNAISPRPINVNFYVTILPGGDRFRLVADDEDIYMYNYVENAIIKRVPSIRIERVYRFGEEIREPNFNFKLAINNNFFINDFVGKTFYFVFNNISDVASYYQSAIDIKTSAPNSSLVKVSVIGGNLEEITDFLNEY